jgi:hypothetical protein
MPYTNLLSRRTIAALASIALVAGCRDKAPVATADSSLSKDLQLAQQVAPPQTVFNDAPVGSTAPTSNAASAPKQGPEQARANAPTPRPSRHRDAPPAPVARSPQQTPPQPVAPAPAPVAVAAAPAAGVIGSGTRLGMSTNAKVCAANLLVGDKFSATVSSGTVGSNGASIPAGSTVVLEVASINKADPIEQSQIQFRVRAIDVNGEPLPVTGDVATLGSLQRVQTSSGNDKTKVIGGAVAGAVLGRIFGGSTKATVIGGAVGAGAGAVAAKAGQSTDACLPPGSALSLTLTHDIVVAHTGAL